MAANPSARDPSSAEAVPAVGACWWRMHLTCADLVTASLLIAVLCTFATGIIPLLDAGAGDLGLVGVLSTDEELAGRTVRHMLETRSPNPNHFFSYGALSFDLAFILLLPFELVGQVSDTAILVTLRGLALASGVAAIALTAALALRVDGRGAACLAAAAVAVTPEVVSWSAIAHPDMLQLALIAATLLAALRLVVPGASPGTGRLLICGALAGLAFGTKYGGALLLPLLLVAVLTARTRRAGPVWRAAVEDSLVLLAAFMAAFVVTNPYALREPARFLGQLRQELAHARGGHVFDVGDGHWTWLRTVAAPTLGGPALTLAALAGGARSLRTVGARRDLLAWIDGRALLVLWAAGYLVYLVAQIGYGAPRHALPLLPALAVLAACALTAGWRVLCARAGRWAALIVAVVGGIVILLPPLHESAGRVTDRAAQAAALAYDPRVLAGRWLDSTAPTGAVILRDAYVYLPPARAAAPLTFGLTAAEVMRVDPDYIVVNEDIRGRFRWEVGADRYLDGPTAYYERMAAYAALEAGELGCYRLLRDFGTVQIYYRQHAC